MGGNSSWWIETTNSAGLCVADASGRNTQLRPHVATPCPASSDHDRAAVQAETSTARCFRHRIRPTKPVATAVIA